MILVQALVRRDYGGASAGYRGKEMSDDHEAGSNENNTVVSSISSYNESGKMLSAERMLDLEF